MTPNYVAGTTLPTGGPGSLGSFEDKAKREGLAQEAKSNALKPVQTWKDILKADLNTLQNNPDALGLSDPQREQMIGQATQAARAQQQGQVSQLSRDAMGAQGFQAGALVQAQKAVADKSEDAAVKAATGVNELHTQLVEQNKARIMADLDAQRERARENTRFWMDFGVQSAGKLVSAIFGVPTSPLSGAMGGAPAATVTPDQLTQAAGTV
jgi:hypothetical protein